MYRPCPGGEIIDSTYDFNTHLIEDIKVDCPFEFSPEHVYYAAKPPKNLLYKALVESDAIAAFVVNNAFIVSVFTNALLCDHWLDPSRRQVFYTTPAIPTKDLCYIGFTKTIVECADVNIKPYHLVYDRMSKKAFLHGQWIDLPESPLPNCENSLYPELCNSDSQGIYLSLTKERRFI